MGTFYAVGVGPGDPRLIALAAGASGVGRRQQPGQQGAVIKSFLFSGKITVSLGSSCHGFIHSLIF